jgi:competence protein ComEC
VSAAGPGIPRSAWLAAGVAAGAGLGAAGASPWLAVSMGAALVALSLGWLAHGQRGRLGMMAGLGIGLASIGIRMIAGPPESATPVLPDGVRGPWTAIVESVGAPRDGDQVARLRLDAAGGTVTVAATLPGYPEINAGSIVEVDGRLRPPPVNDPYGSYLLRSGASGTLDGTRMRLVEPGPSVSVQATRDGAGDALQLALPEPEAGLAAGILIGLRERVDRDLAAAFATAGASHIVAISGWNIAIVAGIVGALLRGRSRRQVAVIVGGTIAVYVVAAGASPSVVRAAVMASVVLIARETGRAGRAPAALAWAATILLLIGPEMIADAGFRLSVAATAGLLAWSTPLGRWLGRIAGGRLPGWLAESLGISLAAQLATLPDVLATFGRLSLVAPVVNLLVVPIVPVAMAGGLIALVGGWLVMAGAPAILATLAGLPGWLVLHVIVLVVRAGASVPMASIALPPELTLPTGLLAAAVIAALLAWLRHRRPAGDVDSAGDDPPARTPAAAPAARRPTPTLPSLGAAARAAIVASLIVSCIGAAVVANAASRTTRLTVLDVGQGDAILLESRTGARMLIDGGPDPARLMVLLDERIPPWDRRLDIVVLTHPHEDHVAGLVRVLERYSVGRVYEPGMHGPGPGWRAWDELLRRGPPRGTLATGQRIVLGEIGLDVLWPDPGTVPVEPGATGRIINDTSIVLLGEANGRRFLLTGDAEDDVDPVLLGRGLPHVDVLKVAHHGSATATSQPLLDALRTSVAVISVGAHNDYGHPAPSTVDRLRGTGARVYRTDQDGTVTIDLRADGVVVHASGGRTAATGALLAAAGGRTGYDRGHDDPRPEPGGARAVLARAGGVVPAARLRGRRRGRVDRAPRADEWRRCGPAARRGRRAPARRGQARVRGHARRPPARRGVGCLARCARLARARADRPRPSGHAAGRAGLRRVDVVGVARGPDRGLRRQARGPAVGADVGAVRVMAAPVSARLRTPRPEDGRQRMDR